MEAKYHDSWLSMTWCLPKQMELESDEFVKLLWSAPVEIWTVWKAWISLWKWTQLHSFQVSPGTVLDPPLIHHPPKPIQPRVLIPTIAHWWTARLLYVGQFHRNMLVMLIFKNEQLSSRAAWFSSYSVTGDYPRCDHAQIWFHLFPILTTDNWFPYLFALIQN